MQNRQCGSCTLCCKLVPVQELDKNAGEVCPHQRHFKGCAVYDKRPRSCKSWSCEWLLGNETELPGIKRPDQAHYVIDCVPDYVKIFEAGGSEPIKMGAIQIWIDPKYPNAHRDPALRELLIEKYAIGIIRFDAYEAINLIPPVMVKDKVWVEMKGAMEDRHTGS